MKYLLPSTCFFLFTSFFVKNIPSRKELANRWVIEKDRYDSSKMFLVHPYLENHKERGDVEFFINKYTSTLRIKFVEPLGGFPKCNHVYRCLTGSPKKEWKPHKCLDYTKQSLCAYDATKGLLKIKDPDFLGGTLFQVENSTFKEITLKRIR